jgi:cell division initiation protein
LAIRPVDIRRKEFKGGFRGYDANQVDDFLDSIADEFERVFSENRRLAEEVEVLRGRLEQFEELEDSIRTALVHAEQVSRDLRQNANKEAELIVREAKERAHRILADSSGRVERVQESYEVLRKAKQDFANDFRRLLKSYLAVMDNIDVASAREIEASLRGRLDLESVTAAREAAEVRSRTEDEPAAETTSGVQGEAEGGGTTARSVEAITTPAGGTTGEHGPEPEVEEPEVEPSSTQDSPGQESAAREAAAAPEPAAEEVDREEPMPAEEGRAYDEFFDRGEGGPRNEDAEEERKLFRASRFLRRRGS